MTDNSIIPVATGNETFANHDIGGIKYPRVRITWGASGATNDADIAAGKGLPIQGSVSITGTPTVVANVGTGTQPVSGTVNVGASLPAGTAHIGEVKIDPTQVGRLSPAAFRLYPVVSNMRRFRLQRLRHWVPRARLATTSKDCSASLARQRLRSFRSRTVQALQWMFCQMLSVRVSAHTTFRSG